MKKIVIIGPESTGKSTLCEQLAAHYNTEWVREYAREYLLRNGAAYAYDDLLEIAKGQVTEEELAVASLQSASKLQAGNMGKIYRTFLSSGRLKPIKINSIQANNKHINHCVWSNFCPQQR